jgi:hypothetical protein
VCLNRGDLKKNVLQNVISKIILRTSHLSVFVGKIIIEIGYELTSKQYLKRPNIFLSVC